MSELFAFDAPIKAISLWQPWASLIAAGVKRHETRHWPTSHRRLIAIHAAQKIDVAGAPEALCQAALGANWHRTVPIGMVVAVARLTHCREARTAARCALTRADLDAGNFTPGRYAWTLDDVRRLDRPSPATGRQGLWNWTPPEDLAERLSGPIDHASTCRFLGWV